MKSSLKSSLILLFFHIPHQSQHQSYWHLPTTISRIRLLHLTPAAVFLVQFTTTSSTDHCNSCLPVELSLYNSEISLLALMCFPTYRSTLSITRLQQLLVTVFKLIFSYPFTFFFFFFFFFGPHLWQMEVSRLVTISLHHSHSNTRSELHL